MRTLQEMLREASEEVLFTLTESWGIQGADGTEATINALHEAMLDPANTEQVWSSLTDDQRQALQTLLGSSGQMPMAMFSRLFGDIRRMGMGAVQREQPHKRPQSPAEALFYRGLVAEAFQIGDNGTVGYAYVPQDLKLVLPTHLTAYKDLEADSQPDPLAALDRDTLTETRAADTTIVDDLTTLLAFAQLYAPPLDGATLARGSLEQLAPYLLVRNGARVGFMLMVGIDAGLMEVQNGRLYVRRADARRWLEASRAEQVAALVKTWQGSTLYRELWQVPGLKPERADGYHPEAGRKALLSGLHGFVPASDWWDLDEFIYSVKQQNPDFQRPNGDYDSWYIQDMGGEYVHGFESWDTVEGPLLEFMIQGPMHWLGLVDIAPEAARLTAYGRGAIGQTAFPQPKDPDDTITLEPDGTLRVSRKISRLERFQVARFTAWDEAPDPASGDPFVYRLTRASIAQADTQGINTGHIRTFLGRVNHGEPLSDRIEHLLTHSQQGDTAAVTIEPMMVLRTTNSEVLDDMLNTPDLRRYLGSRLGPTAVAVRADQWQTLAHALTELGLDVEVIGG